jgi:aspartyl-tRNA(Asn)/glutamyl-tRNA(Gln) amidotransferase subunit A
VKDRVPQLTIHEVGPLIRAKEVSPVELTALILERIAEYDGELHSYISVFYDDAMEVARRRESEVLAGHYRGPLHGVPICIKDNLAVAGWATTNGSSLMADKVTDYDATVVRLLRNAGAVIVGKNNMHEWAMGGTCTGMAYGTVHNPWDLRFVPGGSSGGSAAAVSASLAFAAIGTDGMGSIRMPAAYCGVVGMKPSYGLVSRFGELPPTSSWIDHVGPLCKDVLDAKIVLSAIIGPDPKDPTSRQSDGGGRRRAFDGLENARIGVVTDYFADDLVPDARDRFDAVVGCLERAGLNIQNVALHSLEDVSLTSMGIHSERETFLLPFARRGDGFASEDIRLRILSSSLVSAHDYRLALRLRSRIREEFCELMKRVDVLLTPVTSTSAFEIGAPFVSLGAREEPVDMRTAGSENRVTCRLTYPFNVVGAPAVSLPTGPLVNGLPFGVQLAAAPFDDAYLLDVAEAVEQMIGIGYSPAPAYA